MRGASYNSAPAVVRVVQRTHPQFTWLVAEGKRSEDAQKKTDVVLDLQDETKAEQMAAFRKTDATGRPVGGRKRYAFTDIGLKLSVRFIGRAAPEGIASPTVYRSSEVVDQPETFIGTSKSSADAKSLLSIKRANSPTHLRRCMPH